jgi:hypothetical protein
LPRPQPFTPPSPASRRARSRGCGLLAFFAQQPLDEQSPAAFVSLLWELGIQARELEVRGAENVSRTVVRACLGQGSETTQGWAVVGSNPPPHFHES